MIDLAVPAIFLSFDDHWEMEWLQYLPILAAFGIKATFYSCLRRLWILPLIETAEIFAEMVKPEYWQALHAIADAGHTIGYHTINHANMDVLARQQGVEEAMRSEIYRGLKYFADAGLQPKHFCYPYGRSNSLIDAELLRHFVTLRTIVQPDQLWKMRYYTPDDIKQTRIFIAYDLKYKGCFDAVDKVIKDKRIGFFFAHRPSDYTAELNEFFRVAKEGGATFYPMSALE
jgi:peptidoglycan/xylan/chitin deacetylase (PgdA/CDA1 family)